MDLVKVHKVHAFDLIIQSRNHQQRRKHKGNILRGKHIAIYTMQSDAIMQIIMVIARPTLVHKIEHNLSPRNTSYNG